MRSMNLIGIIYFQRRYPSLFRQMLIDLLTQGEKFKIKIILIEERKNLFLSSILFSDTMI
jgi:hypothetical protein